MFKIKQMGNFDRVPVFAAAIINGDTGEISQKLETGTWSVNDTLKIRDDIEISPLYLAVIMKQLNVIKLLAENGANVNDTDHSPILGAVRFCDKEIIEGLVKLGADIHTVNHVNSDAFLEALYGRKRENLLVIERLGHTAREYGGPALRHAVFDGDKEVVNFFLKHGTDINYGKQDQYYPQGDTPVAVATQCDNLEMVKFLVQQGADVTICNGIGVRPYIIALENGNEELADYIKFLEPEEFHNQLNRLYQLKSYRLPKELVQFLQGDELKIELGEKCTIPYVTFFALQDTVEMQVGKRKLLRLSKETGKFSELILVWMKKENTIGCYDIDHDDLEPMATFREFMKEPAKYMEALFE